MRLVVALVAQVHIPMEIRFVTLQRLGRFRIEITLITAIIHFVMRQQLVSPQICSGRPDKLAERAGIEHLPVDSLLVSLEVAQLRGLIRTLVTAVPHLLVNALYVTPQMALLRGLVVANVTGIADAHVGNLHVLGDLVAEMRRVRTLLAPDLGQIFLVRVDPMPVEGARVQRAEPARVTDEDLLLRRVQVANVALERAHVRIELAAKLAGILEAQVDPLLVAAQVALVCGAIAADITRILDPQVHPFPVLFHGLPAQEVGPAQVAGCRFPAGGMTAGDVLPQFLPTRRAHVTEATGDLTVLAVIHGVSLSLCTLGR